LKYLNVNCLLKGGLFCKIDTRVSYGIKKRERRKRGEERGWPEGRNTNPFFLVSCSIDMQG